MLLQDIWHLAILDGEKVCHLHPGQFLGRQTEELAGHLVDHKDLESRKHAQRYCDNLTN